MPFIEEHPDNFLSTNSFYGSIGFHRLIDEMQRLTDNEYLKDSQNVSLFLRLTEVLVSRKKMMPDLTIIGFQILKSKRGLLVKIGTDPLSINQLRLYVNSHKTILYLDILNINYQDGTVKKVFKSKFAIVEDTPNFYIHNLTGTVTHSAYTVKIPYTARSTSEEWTSFYLLHELTL